MAVFRLSTMQSITRLQEQQEQARLAEARENRRKVDARREHLQWDMSHSGASPDTSATMSALAAARANRLTQSFQLDALLNQADLAVDTAQKQWSQAAQAAAAIDKLHARFLVDQRSKEHKAERDEAQEVAQMQWLANRKGALNAG